MSLDPRVVAFLKKSPNGEEAVKAVKHRTEVQMKSLDFDPMTERVKGFIEKMSGRILDVGCYGGWLYHLLGRPKDYTGIDSWPAAIQAAKELFPEGDFRLSDVFDYEGQHDYVWCSQVRWSERANDAKKKMMSLAPHGTIIFLRDDGIRLGLQAEGALVQFRW